MSLVKKIMLAIKKEPQQLTKREKVAFVVIGCCLAVAQAWLLLYTFQSRHYILLLPAIPLQICAGIGARLVKMAIVSET